MATTADVATYIIRNVPRASNIPTATLVSIGNNEVRQDLQTDFVASYPDTILGQFVFQSFMPKKLAAVVGAAGLVEVGQYDYVVVFVTPERDQLPGQVSSIVTLKVISEIDLTGIPTGDETVISRKIFRRKGGNGDFKLVTTIANNTTTTFTDNVPDASLGAVMTGITLPTDFDSALELQDNTVSFGRRKYVLTTGPRSNIDRNDAAVHFSTDPPNITLNPEKSYFKELLLEYRQKIGDMVEVGDLPYPLALHDQILPLLGIGISFYFLSGKPGDGDDDQVAKLDARYRTLKANFFDVGGVR